MLTPKELILRPQPVLLSEFDLTQSNPSRMIACLNPPFEAVQAGHAIALPDDTFDVRQILKQVPSHFQPDLVSLSARVMTFQPRGLHALNCPTAMKLGDTFHLGDGGLSQMIRYCQKLNCDYHWTYQSAQHLHFFAEAGLKNVFWLPASIVLKFYVPPTFEKSYDVIFRGSKSELHCYRNYLLNRLCHTGINIQTKDYIRSLQDYAKSHIVINTSLNGDLNRRVFEVLMAGGFLLTDRIRSQTGLFDLLEEGTHFECYGDETELLEKIQFYLAHPEQAAQIATAGHQQFLKYYSPHTIQQKLYCYIFKNQIEPLFRLQHDPRSHTSFNLYTRIKLYEVIQELHRLNTRLNLLCYHTHPEIASDLADLSRTHLTYIVEAKNIAPIKTSFAQTGILTQLSLQSSLPADSRFQIVLLNGTRSIQSLQQHIQDTLPYLDPLGFLIVVNPQLIAIQQLNQSLKKHDYFPIELSVKLFDQLYPLTLENHGLMYQKVLPAGYSQNPTLMADLTVNEISSAKVIQQQLKHLSIVRPLIRALRSIRSLLHQ
ncbi:glycosyltransferase family 1 protein [Cyanobacteria bacterium FACHB-63]|nr:glycosyltransferase family 1 protein [Cyanobacteria bacterium FACHB-63]